MLFRCHVTVTCSYGGEEVDEEFSFGWSWREGSFLKHSGYPPPQVKKPPTQFW